MREDRLIEPVAGFFTQRVFGPTRKILLADSQSIPQIGPTLDARRAAVEADLANLQRRQTNLMRELADHQTTGDLDFDTAWRAAIQDQFAATLAEQRDRTRVLDEITRQKRQAVPPDLDLIDRLPMAAVDITRLPEVQQRELYDAFHLEVRYDLPTDSVILRVAIEAETASALANAIDALVDTQATSTTQKRGGGADQAPPPLETGGMFSVPPAGHAGRRKQLLTREGVSSSSSREFA